MRAQRDRGSLILVHGVAALRSPLRQGLFGVLFRLVELSGLRKGFKQSVYEADVVVLP